jgi:hypothetical protein
VHGKLQESSAAGNKLYMMRRLLWEDSMYAVKLSSEFSSFQAFRKELEKTLPQNSSYVRKRNTASIIRWFFPSRSIENPLTKVWTFYRNELLLKELMRYQYLTTEPVVAEFILKHVLARTPGEVIKIEHLKDFLVKKYGVVKPDPLRALSGAIRYTGFVCLANRGYTISDLDPPKTALLILVHYLFAPTPRTVTVKEILANSFWQYIGIRSPEIVKKILQEADANGAIAKYIVADQLEQITTRYSFDEFIQRKIRL